MARRWVAGLAWTGALAIVGGLVAWALAPKPIDVELTSARQGPFERTIEAEGRTRVRDRYVVSAPVAGRLLRVSLKAGDRVERGTPLAVIVPIPPSMLDARTLQELTERVGAAEAELERAKATTQRATAALALAQSELGRQRELARTGFVSRQVLDRAERDAELKDRELAAAKFEEHGAEHQLSLARNAVSRIGPEVTTRPPPGGRWRIDAPVAGRVLKVLQQSEAVVASGTPLLELGDPDDLEVVADLLTADAASVRAGAPVRFDAGDGTSSRGRVRLVEPGGFTKISALGVEEQRVNVVMDFVPPRATGGSLGDAYRVDVRIVIDDRASALVIPVAALFRASGGWAVYVADGNRARLRPLDIAARGARSAVVERGLVAGERVVVYPSDALRDGVRIRVRGASPASTNP